MKKILKISAISLFVLIAAAALFLTYIVKFKPNIPVEEIKIEYTPARIERGKYLAHSVALCIDCHSSRDWTRYSAPSIPGSEGKGGEVFDKKLGFPGTYYASNLTPFHLKDWSDGELFRAITAGVSKDGRPLFPVMPYPHYGQMDREDIYAIIAYLRSLPSIENNLPPSNSNFPMNIIIHTIPSKPNFTTIPPTTDKVNYGRYLATSAACIECHTPAKRGQIIEELAFSGGRYLLTPSGESVASSNITPDKTTGIGNWSEEVFIQQFKVFDRSVSNFDDKLKEGDANTVMPWQKYSGMTREDLAAIYAYLQTIKPVSNQVPRARSKK